MYWTYDFPGSDIKGNHANVKTEFIVVCISGKAFIKVIDKFNSHTDFLLDSSSKGVYIPPAYWREIQASEGSVVLVLASEEYLDSDYIRVREDFFI